MSGEGGYARSNGGHEGRTGIADPAFVSPAAARTSCLRPRSAVRPAQSRMRWFLRKRRSASSRTMALATMRKTAAPSIIE